MLKPVDPSSLGSGTVVVLPDLQNYTGKGGKHFWVLMESMRWIVAERERLGIDLVIQVGDLTDRDQPDEWERAREAFSVIDGKLPYVLTVGNHDLGGGWVGLSRETCLNDYFKVGQNPQNADSIISAWQKGRMENTASIIPINGVQWLILALEFGPREGAVEWADQILIEHSGLPTLLVTHEYIDQLSFFETGRVQHTRPETHNSPYAYPLSDDEGGVNCGEELWAKLVSKHSQIRGVLNGHYRPYELNKAGKIIGVDGLSSATRRDVREDGSVVEQIMFNAQWDEKGGNGWMLLLQPFTEHGLRPGRYSPVIGQTKAKDLCIPVI